MHGMSREIHRIIGRFKRKSIVEIIRLKDGLDSRIMGLEVWKSAIETSSPCMGDDSFSISMIFL